MKHCIKRNSKVFKLALIFTIVGLLAGITLYLNLDKETKELIINSFINLNKNLNETKQNNIIYHLFILSSFMLLSLTLFLYPITILYIFYEIFSFGFILSYYANVSSIGGIIYAFVYFMLNKALFLIILIYISLISYKLIKKIINSIIKKDNISVQRLYINYFQRIFICAIILLIINIFIYFLGNKILSLFQFLL